MAEHVSHGLHEQNVPRNDAHLSTLPDTGLPPFERVGVVWARLVLCADGVVMTSPPDVVPDDVRPALDVVGVDRAPADEIHPILFEVGQCRVQSHLGLVQHPGRAVFVGRTGRRRRRRRRVPRGRAGGARRARRHRRLELVGTRGDAQMLRVASQIVRGTLARLCFVSASTVALEVTDLPEPC